MGDAKQFQGLSGSPSLSPDDALSDDFSQIVDKTMDEWKVPGLSIAVIDGSSIFARGYGNSTLPNRPSAPDTVYFAASTTKAFTAALLSHLIHSGKYPCLAQGWATPISSIIHDDFVLQDDWATRHLTLEDAVVHRTGMPRHDRASAHKIDGRRTTARDIVRNMRNLPLTVEPRTKFVYCNAMYVVLSHVIETVTGKALGDVLREEIWAPLGMDSTFFCASEAKKQPVSVATGYFWNESSQKFKSVKDMGVDELSGAGAVLSTATDYAKWVRCLLHEAQPFTKDVHRDIRTMRIVGMMPMGAYDVNLYGLGWQRTLYKGHPLYHHSGGLHAFGSQVYWLPEQKFGVVGFGNTMMSSNAVLEILAYKLVDSKLGISPEARFDFAKLWKGILRMMISGVDGAIKDLYPDVPETPLPSPLTTGELTGTYKHPGYGTFTLCEESDPDTPDKIILVADRPDMTWRYKLEMHHVSGTYWIVYNKHLDTPNPLLQEYSSMKVNVGHDGKCVSIDIHWMNRMGVPVDAGISTLGKVA